ncbi:MAG TPA: hypothetical protein VH763_10655 [Gemmatimonadales bacterium]|jgi:hypothetical protein
MKPIRTGLLALLALTAGCGASRAPIAQAPAPSAAARSDSALKRRGIPVQIDSQNFSDMDIYLINAGQRLLIGEAAGLNMTTLFIPASATRADGQVRLLATPLGGSSPVATPLLIVPPGEGIFWNIGIDQGMSSVSTGTI